jgi:hypothetical protein
VQLHEVEKKPVPVALKWKKVQLKKKLQPRILPGEVAEVEINSAVRTITINNRVCGGRQNST